MSLIDEALKHTTDTKACIIAAGAIEGTVEIFRKLFPGSGKALIIEDPNTKRVAGDRVCRILETAGIKCQKHVICPGGERFHAVYGKVEEVRCVLGASDGVPVAVGSGTINDIVKRASEETGKRYMVVGTAASMDGYTSYGAAITKDGMKQTLDCKAPLGCIVDSEVAAAAPAEMTASGYADLIAKIPAGAD
jgi:glycerol-1-phosphate dehydrogenase [NAD(P)+]